MRKKVWGVWEKKLSNCYSLDIYRRELEEEEEWFDGWSRCEMFRIAEWVYFWILAIQNCAIPGGFALLPWILQDMVIEVWNCWKKKCLEDMYHPIEDSVWQLRVGTMNWCRRRCGWVKSMRLALNLKVGIVVGWMFGILLKLSGWCIRELAILLVLASSRWFIR